jgi:hypothetical protein
MSIAPLGVPRQPPKTKIPLWIITHEPKRTQTLWQNGRCTGIPLSTFIAEISKVTQQGGIKEITLTLTTPTLDIRIKVSKDADNLWESVGKTFVAEMKGIAKAGGETGDCKILIEPVYLVRDQDA